MRQLGDVVPVASDRKPGLSGEGDAGEPPAVHLRELLGHQRRLQCLGHSLLLLEPVRPRQRIGPQSRHGGDQGALLLSSRRGRSNASDIAPALARYPG